MAQSLRSVGDLCRKAEITDTEIEAAAEAYERAPGAEPSAFQSGHTVDIAKAIEVHPQARKLLADEATPVDLRRTMVRTTIIMGYPVTS